MYIFFIPLISIINMTYKKYFVTIIMNFLFSGEETEQGTDIFPF